MPAENATLRYMNAKAPPLGSTQDPLSLRMTTELRAKLDALAKADGRSTSDYVRRVLEEHAAKSRKRKA